MKHSKKVAALGILALGGAVFALTWNDAAKKSTTTTSASAPAAKSASLLAFRFAPDTTYAYGLRYGSKTKAVPMVGAPNGQGRAAEMGDPVEGDLDLEGTLEIHSYGDSTIDGEEATLLGFSLKDCKGHFTLAGQPAWGDNACGAQLDNRELLVRVDRFGRVRSVHAPASGANLFDYTMRALVEETQVRLAEVAGVEAWVETELLPQGSVESLYRFTSPVGTSTTIERTRPRYNSLSAASMMNGAPVEQDESATHTIQIVDGVLTQLHGKEKLRATSHERTFLDSTTEVDLASHGSRLEERAHPDLSAYAKRKLEDLPESTSLHTRMLEQRAGGLSWAQALDTLHELGDAGHVPDHNRFLWRSTALLELDPKRAFDLVDVFNGGHRGGKLRGLVMDLLASVPTPEAQKVLRQLLASEQAKNDPRYVQLIQRIGFVDQPDKDTIAFMRAKIQDATAAKNKNQRLASAYTLGTMAGHTRDEAATKQIVDDLTEMLDDAPPNELVYYLNALSNTDSASAFGTFAKHAQSEDPAVREAVADALDDPQLPESLALLLRLAGDPDRNVQHAALKSLRDYKLDGPVIFKLAQMVHDRKLASMNVRSLLDLVKTYRRVVPTEMEGLLKELLAQPLEDPLARAAAQQLLDGN